MTAGWAECGKSPGGGKMGTKSHSTLWWDSACKGREGKLGAWPGICFSGEWCWDLNKMQSRWRVGAASAMFGEGLQALLVSWRLMGKEDSCWLWDFEAWSNSGQKTGTSECRCRKAKNCSLSLYKIPQATVTKSPWSGCLKTREMHPLPVQETRSQQGHTSPRGSRGKLFLPSSSFVGWLSIFDL